MSNNIFITIIINIGILLIASWILGGFIIRALSKEKHQLLKQLEKLRKKKALAPEIPEPVAPPQPPAPVIESTGEDLSELLEEMAQEIAEKEDRIKSLLSIKDNQKQAHNAFQAANQQGDNTEELTRYMMQLEADFEATEHIILSLQKDLEDSRAALESMEKQQIEGELLSSRIFTLEKSERRLRDENSHLRSTGNMIADTLEARNEQINSLKESNHKLKKTINSLTNASKEQLALIQKLNRQVSRAEELEAHQRQLIDDLEKRLNSEKGNNNDAEKVAQMERELEELKGTLKRTLIEKEFIEEHMLEMDDSLEKAKEMEEALERAQKEIEALEKHYPEFEPSVDTIQTETTNTKETTSENNTPVIEDTSDAPKAFTTDIPELEDIMEDNRLFGALQEFWVTLDTPPINLDEIQYIEWPNIEDWVHTTIGNNDYRVLFAIDSELAEIASQSLFKGGHHGTTFEKKHDTAEKLCHTITKTLAEELEQGFSVSKATSISLPEAKADFDQATLVCEALVSSKGKPIYLALMIPQ